jgi:hypothetical protein
MAQLHTTVRLCCARFIGAYDQSSRALVSYIDENGKAALYITDWRNMLQGPIEFCPFCGAPVEIGAHEQLIVGVNEE